MRAFAAEIYGERPPLTSPVSLSLHWVEDLQAWVAPEPRAFPQEQEPHAASAAAIGQNRWSEGPTKKEEKGRHDSQEVKKGKARMSDRETERQRRASTKRRGPVVWNKTPMASTVCGALFKNRTYPVRQQPIDRRGVLRWNDS